MGRVLRRPAGASASEPATSAGFAPVSLSAHHNQSVPECNKIPAENLAAVTRPANFTDPLPAPEGTAPCTAA